MSASRADPKGAAFRQFGTHPDGPLALVQLRENFGFSRRFGIPDPRFSAGPGCPTLAPEDITPRRLASSRHPTLGSRQPIRVSGVPPPDSAESRDPYLVGRESSYSIPFGGTLGRP
jgi:hypothetical protein